MANILIVDDSLIMRRNLMAILREAGHTIVGEAVNGQQAYLMYKRFRPDIVTMDITMPKIDGIDALKNIMENFPDAKVVMVSALDQKSKVYAALRKGAKHYIVKPLTADKIISVIDAVIIGNPEKDVIIRDKQKIESPFLVEQKEGFFLIRIKKDLELHDTMILEGAVQGFLYLDKPEIHFAFEGYEMVGEDALTRFDALLIKIRNVHGTSKVFTKKQTFVKWLTLKDHDLSSVYNAGEYIVE